MIQIKSVDKYLCDDVVIKDRQSIYTFLQRYPCLEDADHRSQIYVYKPPGWPEELQPQYKDAPCHILSIDGAWIKVKWNRFHSCSYCHPDWKKRLLFTHWKPSLKPIESFVFDNQNDLYPSVPLDLKWDTLDWSEIYQLVEQARDLIAQGSYADRHEIHSVHFELERLLEIDDPFLLNQWFPSFRQYGWRDDFLKP